MEHFQCKIVKMCGRTCVGVTSGKKARAHTLRTHVSEVISHAHAHMRPHIARVRARTHLRNPYLEKYPKRHMKIVQYDHSILVAQSGFKKKIKNRLSLGNHHQKDYLIIFFVY